MANAVSALLMAKLSRRVAKILRKMFMRKKLKISSIGEERGRREERGEREAAGVRLWRHWRRCDDG